MDSDDEDDEGGEDILDEDFYPEIEEKICGGVVTVSMPNPKNKPNNPGISTLFAPIHKEIFDLESRMNQVSSQALSTGIQKIVEFAVSEKFGPEFPLFPVALIGTEFEGDIDAVSNVLSGMFTISFVDIPACNNPLKHIYRKLSITGNSTDSLVAWWETVRTSAPHNRAVFLIRGDSTITDVLDSLISHLPSRRDFPLCILASSKFHSETLRTHNAFVSRFSILDKTFAMDSLVRLILDSWKDKPESTLFIGPQILKVALRRFFTQSRSLFDFAYIIRSAVLAHEISADSADSKNDSSVLNRLALFVSLVDFFTQRGLPPIDSLHVFIYKILQCTTGKQRIEFSSELWSKFALLKISELWKSLSTNNCNIKKTTLDVRK